MTLTKYDALVHHLQGFLPRDRVITDDFHTRALGADASFYRMKPEVVVTVTSEEDVRGVLAACRRHRTPVTFRAAGTSLSGQAVTDSVLARLGDGWNTIEVQDEGARIRLGAGVIGSAANVALAPYGRKLGPDPASIGACMISGITANNASGMCCGTEQNSYKTVRSMRLILADGTLLDTGDPASVASFRTSHAGLLDGLSELRNGVMANQELAQRIRRKYSIKNTTGYSLNALVDFEDPIDILTHLIVGSEGTLGFISEVVFDTVPDPSCKAATLAFYECPRTAADVVTALKDAPVSAVELMDRAGIRSAEGKPDMPDFLPELPSTATALLIEVQGHCRHELEGRLAEVGAVLEHHEALRPFSFSHDPAVCASYWKLRKGLFPAVGGLREIGTTVIIEDVAFPLEHLGEGVTDLQALFERWEYKDAILFGHARDGNLHVVFSQDFRSAKEVERYSGFMDELCEMVVKRYDGSLKAEHGTGRNVAPFVELEWGRTALELMHVVKDLFDSERLLNPGVILNEDPLAHVKNLKDLPAAHPIVDTCTECGFCESKCPSQLLTLSPRQRTVAFRNLLTTQEGSKEALRTFAYAALDTCAACGLCATVCPMKIDTGAFVKELRAQGQSTTSQRLAEGVLQNFGLVQSAASLGLRAAQLARTVIGAGATEALSSAATTVSGGALPKWHRAVPGGYGFSPQPVEVEAPQATFVYMPSCVSRTMQPRETKALEPLPRVVERVAARAGIRVVYPEDVNGLCCGQPFDSKGFPEQAKTQGTQALDAVLRALPADQPIRVLSDTSPCTSRLAKLAGDEGREVVVVDLIEFLHDWVLPKIPFRRTRTRLAVHATCSLRKMGLAQKLEALAQACADEVTSPTGIECCGFAGDKGFNRPELNAHALRTLSTQIDGAEAGCSASITCEIGLTQHGGVPYRSIAYFVDEATGGIEVGRQLPAHVGAS